MTSSHSLLGIPSDATLAQAKAAYHVKLREFPARTHPTEFKAIRAAYEAIKTGIALPEDNFFKPKSIEMSIDPLILDQLKKTLTAHLEVSLDDMLRDTF